MKKLEVSEKRRLKTIKKIVREALEDWEMSMKENIFLNSKPVDFGVETDSGKPEFLLYGGD